MIRDIPNPTVLVVDDELDIRESLSVLLASAIKGAHIEIAPSGPAALEILRNRPVHLIVTDYRMPGMSGLEFLAKAHEVAPDVPSIMITAYPDPHVAAQAIQGLGVKRYVLKPLEPEVIIGAVREVLEA